MLIPTQDTIQGWRHSGMVMPKTGCPPSVDDWTTLRDAQGDTCGVCQQLFIQLDPSPFKRHRYLKAVLDHDHTTGLVRGIVCQSCNVKLGRPPNYCGAADAVQRYLANPPAMAGLHGGKMPLLPYTPSLSAQSTGGYATRGNAPGIYAVAPLGPEHGGIRDVDASRRRWNRLRP